MRNILIISFLLISIPAFSQQKSIVGTIWKTEAKWSEKDQDSIYYSLTFKEKKAVLKCKYKKFARVRVIEEINWKHPPILIPITETESKYGPPDYSKVEFNKSWYYPHQDIIDNSLYFYQFSVDQNSDGSQVSNNNFGEGIRDYFYLSTENTLQGTVWTGFSSIRNNHVRDQLTVWKFEQKTVKIYWGFIGESVSLMDELNYSLIGNRIKLSGIKDQLTILPNRNQLRYKDAKRYDSHLLIRQFDNSFYKKYNVKR